MKICKFVMPEVIFGPGSLGQIAESAQRLGAEKIFLVTDEGLRRAGWVDKALAVLQDWGMNFELWSQVTPNPKDYEVEGGAKQYLAAGCDAIVGLGGGSPIDAAKGIAVLVSNGGRIHDYEGVDKVSRPLPPMIMIPSTAGTGADVSQFAVITDTKRKIKMVLVSKSLVPDISIVDPLLLTTKDAMLTANTGLDALAHAVEAYVSSAATPLTDVLALNAVRLIAGNLRESVASQNNLQAKEAMAMASLQAGLAFSNAILGAVHAMAHQLGGLRDMPHGAVDAVLLPYVMEYNLIAAVDRFVDIAVAMGENVSGLSRRDAAARAIRAVRQLNEDLGIPNSLREIGLGVEDIPRLSQNAVKDPCLLTNPRDIGVSEIAEIFYRAWEGKIG